MGVVGESLYRGVVGGIPVQGCSGGQSLYRGVVGGIPVQGCSGWNPCAGVWWGNWGCFLYGEVQSHIGNCHIGPPQMDRQTQVKTVHSYNFIGIEPLTSQYRYSYQNRTLIQFRESNKSLKHELG